MEYPKLRNWLIASLPILEDKKRGFTLDEIAKRNGLRSRQHVRYILNSIEGFDKALGTRHLYQIIEQQNQREGIDETRQIQ